jgi:hypothetical protein
MPYSYTLNCGQYVLTEDGRPIGRVLDEVSLALDIEEHTLHKHGAPEMVQAWLQRTQAKLRAGGAEEMANRMVCLTGRFPLEELNRCLQVSGYAGRLYLKAMAGELAQLPLDAKALEAAPVTAPSTRRMRV